MAGHVLALVLAIALAPVSVFGGSRAWESSISYAPVQALTDRALLMGENATIAAGFPPAVHINRKRYITIKPGDANADTRRWPNGVIKYCFEDKTWPEKDGRTTREILFDDLREARDLWNQAGLQEGFGWDEMDAAACVDSSRRSEFLLIQYNTDSKMSTTPGLPAMQSGSNVGPRMLLSDSLEMGMLNVVANYAHEMGHAWGMYHEHQNQAFWGAPYSEAGGKFFGQGNWNCRNLRDYDIVRNRLGTQGISNAEADRIMEKACTQRSEALARTFSAFDYLPITDEPVLASQKKDVDWDSIMIYPSGSGGIGSAAGGVDNRLPILLKPNGDPIPKNLRPSVRDVDGLKKLYGYKSSSTWRALGDKASSVKSKFDAIRKKDPASGCQ